MKKTALVALALVLSACSGSDSSSAETSASATQAQTSATQESQASSGDAVNIAPYLEIDGQEIDTQNAVLACVMEDDDVLLDIGEEGLSLKASIRDEDTEVFQIQITGEDFYYYFADPQDDEDDSHEDRNDVDTDVEGRMVTVSGNLAKIPNDAQDEDIAAYNLGTDEFERVRFSFSATCP